jgi:DNA-binding CsgD family transcriptional regulator
VPVAETAVNTHLGPVVTKPGLRNYVQAVVYTYEAGVVDSRCKC